MKLAAATLMTLACVAGVVGFAEARSGYLGGVSVSNPNAPSAQQPDPELGVLLENRGRAVEVVEVIRGTAADFAGVRVGDLVISVDGKRVRASDQLITAIRSSKVGQVLELVVWRGGQSVRLRPELCAKLDSAELLRRRLIDMPAPAFELPKAEGSETVSLKALEGKVVVLEFWSTYCQQCIDGFETLTNLRADHLGKLEVIAITAQTPEAMIPFRQNYHLSLPVVIDRSGEVHRDYRQQGEVPTLIVIGKDGKIRYADSGPTMNMDDIVLEAKRAVDERSF